MYLSESTWVERGWFLIRSVSASLSLLIQIQIAHADLTVPILTSPVVDQALILSPAESQNLREKLLGFSNAKGSQIAVLTVASTKPESIEQYAIRVAEIWKLGRKGVDDGALLLVAKEDRGVRIEVGYGLEGVIPDAKAKRIIDEIIVPRFREGAFGVGITEGVDTIIKLVEGDDLPPAPQASGPALDDSIFILLFGALAIGSTLHRALGPLPAAVVTGSACLAIALFLFPVLLAVAAGIGGFLLALLPPGRSSGFRSGGYRGGGGGFSGGGGGFGGGGASGRW